ncbi:MAG: DUF551 domain-containing protein [[Clostridium] symbiosum]
MNKTNSAAVYAIAKANEGLDRRIGELEEQLKCYQWIPVEERLPEQGQEVIVSCQNSNGDYVTHDEYDWDYCAWASDADDIIAWMPLPEPYRPEMLREAGRKAGQDAAMPVLQSAT